MTTDANHAAALPIPGADAQAHSAHVAAALKNTIQQTGPLTFGEFMQFVLHAPGFGYYSVGNEKFGAQGDFITAPEISDLFAQSVARQIQPVLRETGGDVLEFGAGTGRLACALLNAPELQEKSWQHYYILETSAELAARQRDQLHAALDKDRFAKLQWVQSLPDSFCGVMLANEVVDAMPVERFVVERSGDAPRQQFVNVSEERLEVIVRPACQDLIDSVMTLQNSLGYDFPQGYCSEFNLVLTPWLEALSVSLQHGLLLLIDYGCTEKEYYLTERDQGTLRCYYQHRVHTEPLLYPGLQDITADVNFTQVAKTATEAGFDLHGYTSQACFLLGNGLLEHASNRAPENEQARYRLAQEIQTLAGPAQMGERFQVMGLSKNLDLDLQGFAQADYSHRL